MGLLAPLFLVAAVTVALPFWLHRMKVQSAARQPFSSTMLLETAERQLHVRKKLRYLLLLALRVAVLALLALALAKPIWIRTDPGPTPGSLATHVVLIDTSASMQRDGVLARGKDTARNILDATPDGALLQVLTADARIHVTGALSADKAAHRSAIASLAASGLRLDFGMAMTAIDAHTESLPPPVHLHFVSDFQDSGRPVRFADLSSRNVAELSLYPVGSAAGFNWRIDSVEANASVVEVGVTKTGIVAAGASLRVTLNDQTLGQMDLAESAYGSYSFGVVELQPGDNRLVATIAADDELAIDNTWYRVIENSPPAPVPLITANPDGRAVTYLETALLSDTDANYQVAVMRLGDTDFRTLVRFQWALIDDLGALDTDAEAALLSFAESGGNLLAFVGPLSTAMGQLPITGHRLRPTAAAARESDFLSIGQVDTGHPLLSRTQGWHAVNVTRNPAVDVLDGDQVLIRLEDGTPFLLERRLGEGRVVLLTSGLDNQWNDLPIRPVFVGFIIEAARHLSGVERVRKSFTAGDALPLSLIGGASGQIIDPDGNSVLSLADTTREQQVRLEQPGFYEVYTPKGDYLVGVNTDPRESRPEVMAPQMLQRWRDSAAGSARRSVGTDAEIEPVTHELWHVALLLLVLLLIGESILGNVHFKPQRAG